jgi:twitching motility protein PilT
MFEQGEQSQVRERLASTLRFIVSQRLAPKVGGGRQLLTEIMGSNLRTREIVQLGENENRSMHAAIEAGVTQGWHSFEQDIISHFSAGRITEETAMLYSVNKPAMRQAIDVAKKRLGHHDENATHSFRLSETHPTRASSADAAGAPPPLPPLKFATPASRPPAPATR